MRAVAERAGVNERTVYRHFTNERGLRDAVMHRMEEQAGIDLAALRARGHRRRREADLRRGVDAPAARCGPVLDPTLGDASQRQHEALLRALDPADRGVERGRPHRGGRDVRRALGRGALRAAGGRLGPRLRTRPSPGSPG